MSCGSHSHCHVNPCVTRYCALFLVLVWLYVAGLLVIMQYGWTVVHFAAYNGHLEMLQELLERFNCEADKRDKVNGVHGCFV